MKKRKVFNSLCQENLDEIKAQLKDLIKNTILEEIANKIKENIEKDRLSKDLKELLDGVMNY